MSDPIVSAMSNAAERRIGSSESKKAPRFLPPLQLYDGIHRLPSDTRTDHDRPDPLRRIHSVSSHLPLLHALQLLPQRPARSSIGPSQTLRPKLREPGSSLEVVHYQAWVHGTCLDLRVARACSRLRASIAHDERFPDYSISAVPTPVLWAAFLQWPPRHCRVSYGAE